MNGGRAKRAEVSARGENLGYFEPRDGQGRTALMRASARGDLAAVEEYLEFSNALLVDAAGDTALMLAVKRGSLACARKLAPYLDLDASGLAGMTALMDAACIIGAAALPFVELLRHGSDVLAQDALGRTVMMHAIQTGCLNTACLLASPKAALSSDDKGNTPLMQAVMMRSRELAELLLPMSDLKAKNTEGWTALSLAQAKNEKGIEEMISVFGKAKRERVILEKAAKGVEGQSTRARSARL